MLFLALYETESLAEHELYGSAVGSKLALADYLAAIESGREFGPFSRDGGVGTRGGAGDHTAILNSTEGSLHWYAYGPPSLRKALELPDELVFVVMNSGVRASKTGNAGAAYNRVSRLATACTEVLQRSLASPGEERGDLGAWCEDVRPDRPRRVLAAARHEEFSGQELITRFEQFRLEHAYLLPQACEALERGDLERFGLLVDRSQTAAEQMLRNQVPETSFLQSSAREEGALAASAFGAGFGGAVWALVESGQAEEFSGRWWKRYAERYPLRVDAAETMITRPARSAYRLDSSGDSGGSL
jgi:galactokinase